MTPREIATKAAAIATVGALLLGGAQVMGWMAETDADIERASVQAYCQGVATWQAEAARGIAPERRTGHPDYNGTADEQCRPGNRSAIPNRSTERQLAGN